MSYSVLVVLLSLAIYGAVCLAADGWYWFTRPRVYRSPGVSLVVIVRDAAEEMEFMLRSLGALVDAGDVPCDAVVVDTGSRDLTVPIAQRLAQDRPWLTVVDGAAEHEAVNMALPYCRGGVVHVLDLCRRLAARDFVPLTAALLRQDGRSILVRDRAAP